MPTSDREFTARTHAELARLSTEAATIRRGQPHTAVTGCICKHCTRLARIHAEIDDYLHQLDGTGTPRTDPQLLAVAFTIPGDQGKPNAAKCGVCGRSRFRSFRGVILCLACDGRVSGGDYAALDGNE